MKIISLLLMIISTFMTGNCASRPKYEVLERDALNKYIETNQFQEENNYILEENSVFVYIYKDGSSLMFPPVLGGEEGLLFYNKAEMEKMIVSKVYPVKGTGAFWEKEKPKVLDFNSSIPYYFNKLSSILEQKVEQNSDRQNLMNLSQAINTKWTKINKNDDLKWYTSIVIAELLRLKTQGEWKLFPIFTFNMYYEPEIYKGDSCCSCLNGIFRDLELASFTPINVEAIIEKRAVFYPAAQRRRIEFK